MKHAARLVTLFPIMFAAGCAVSSYCEGEQDYQTAPSVPVVQPTGGLRVQESASALKIPPPPENSIPYGEEYKDEDGDDAIHCLDRPPDLPAPVEPKAEEKKPA